MLSPEAERVLSLLRKTAPIADRMSDFLRNLLQNAVGFLFRTPRGLSHRRANLPHDVKAEWTLPRGGSDAFVVLYCHGGAYVAGNLRYTRILAAKLALVCGAKVFSPAYRLAPRHPFPAAVRDTLAAYRHLIDQGHTRIVVAGESAGGGLTLALPQLIQEEGLPPPVGLVALSPWTDLSCSLPSHAENADVDPTIMTESLCLDAGHYAGQTSLEHPHISPLYADFTGYPPTLLQVGGLEVLLDDTREAERRLREAGVPVVCQIYEGLWHVFQILDLPESKAALAEVGRFVHEVTAD